MTSHALLGFAAVFLPLAVLIYMISPQRARPLVLLALSYGFYFLMSRKLIICLLFTQVSVYFIGLWLDSVLGKRTLALKSAEREEKKKIRAAFTRRLNLIMGLAVALNIGILFVLKYSTFFGTNINAFLEMTGTAAKVPVRTFLLPLGISFYTLTAISYVIDVRRGTTKAERRFLNLALFIGFFGQIIEGPICRSSETAESLCAGKKISADGLLSGAQRIVYGMVKRLVVADRLNMFISAVFTGYEQFDGGITAFAVLCYTIQLYMDFSGTMDIMLGASEIFGVGLPENFRQPFFSKSISEFWTRWHITLGAFFRDYVFYALTMTKPLKKLTTEARARLGPHFGPLISAALALLVVWLLNGLWHGAGWQYIFFGLFHFTMILMGNIWEPFLQKTAASLHINREKGWFRVVRIVKTFMLINIGELFFRAEGLRAGLYMFKNIFTNFRIGEFLNGGIFSLHIDAYDLVLVALVLFVVFIIGVYKERGGSPRAWLNRRHIVLRFAVYYAAALLIIVFAAYGFGYVAVDPIYANF